MRIRLPAPTYPSPSQAVFCCDCCATRTTCHLCYRGFQNFHCKCRAAQLGLGVAGWVREQAQAHLKATIVLAAVRGCALGFLAIDEDDLGCRFDMTLVLPTLPLSLCWMWMLLSRLPDGSVSQRSMVDGMMLFPALFVRSGCYY